MSGGRVAWRIQRRTRNSKPLFAVKTSQGDAVRGVEGLCYRVKRQCIRGGAVVDTESDTSSVVQVIVAVPPLFGVATMPEMTGPVVSVSMSLRRCHYRREDRVRYAFDRLRCKGDWASVVLKGAQQPTADCVGNSACNPFPAPAVTVRSGC